MAPARLLPGPLLLAAALGSLFLRPAGATETAGHILQELFKSGCVELRDVAFEAKEAAVAKASAAELGEVAKALAEEADVRVRVVVRAEAAGEAALALAKRRAEAVREEIAKRAAAAEREGKAADAGAPKKSTAERIVAEGAPADAILPGCRPARVQVINLD